MAWPIYVALGDDLSVETHAPVPSGAVAGWPGRLAFLMAEQTGRTCELTNLAADRATLSQVLEEQLPAVVSLRPDLVSVTVGLNDIRTPEFEGTSFAGDLKRLFDGLAGTAATLLTCTLPEIAERVPIPVELVPLVRERMRLVSEIIRSEASARGSPCVDAWNLPAVSDPALYAPDRVHLNVRGQRLLAEAFAAALPR